MEDLKGLAQMCFGLGFFLFTIWFVIHQSDKEYDRKLNERREFGYGNGTKFHFLNFFRKDRDSD